jgi:murein DD-endopeptidase MepM/ murein hydrolase activator NlpD
MDRKLVNLLITSNYSPRIFRRTMSRGAARALLGLGALVGLIAVGALVLAGTGVYRLARLSYLEERNVQLESEHARITELRERIERLEEQERRYAEMLGIELAPPPVEWSDVELESTVVPDWLTENRWGARPIPELAPLDEYVVSQRFSRDHRAIDLAAQSGTPVAASGDAIVLDRGEDSVFGRFILLEHQQGFQSYYGHLQDWRVEAGDTVLAGATIGTVGSSGRSSAPHLHFEVRRYGERLDPEKSIRFQ